MKRRFPIVRKKIPEGFYKKILNYLPLVCTDVVVVCRAKGKKYFLLIKRKNEPEKGKWWFPGGRIFKNERLADATRRKVWEETHLLVKKLKQIGIYEYFSPVGYSKGMNSHMLAIDFLAEVDIRHKVVLDWQSLNSRWFRKINRRWHPYIKEFLRKVGFR